MKKLILLIFLALFACHGHPIPPSPPIPPNSPPPAPTCAPECGIYPNCHPCPPPPPPPVCKEPNACGTYPNCKPCPPLPPPEPQAKHDTYTSILICCGPTGQPLFDPDKTFRKIAADGLYNFVTIHLLSPWNNVCFYPWTDQLKAVAAWHEHFKAILAAAKKYNVGLHLVFFDRYGVELAKWNSPAIPCKTFPLKMTAKDLFEDWNRQDVNNPKNFGWLFWKADAEDHVISAVPSNAQGKAIIDLYLKPAIQEIADSGAIVWWQPSNEPLAHVTCLNSSCSRIVIDHNSSLEQDPRVTDYIRQLFAAAGLKNPKTPPSPADRFREVNGDQVFMQGGFEPCYKCMVRNQAYLKAHNILLEIHGCNTTYIKLLIASGLDPKLTIFSQDGVKDLTVLPEGISTKALKLSYWEFKLPDQSAPNGHWSSTDLNRNLSTALDYAEKVFR